MVYGCQVDARRRSRLAAPWQTVRLEGGPEGRLRTRTRTASRHLRLDRRSPRCCSRGVCLRAGNRGSAAPEHARTEGAPCPCRALGLRRPGSVRGTDPGRATTSRPRKGARPAIATRPERARGAGRVGRGASPRRERSCLRPKRGGSGRVRRRRPLGGGQICFSGRGSGSSGRPHSRAVTVPDDGSTARRSLLRSGSDPGGSVRGERS
jgi:hypothetical protein